MVLDRLRFFRHITWSLLKDSGHSYLCVCFFRFKVVHCKTKWWVSQNWGVKNWGPYCLRQFFKCSNRKSAVLDQDPSLFFQAIDKAGAFGVSTLFGLLAPNWWRTQCDVGNTNKKESAVYQLWITYLFSYIIRRSTSFSRKMWTQQTLFLAVHNMQACAYMCLLVFFQPFPGLSTGAPGINFQVCCLHWWSFRKDPLNHQCLPETQNSWVVMYVDPSFLVHWYLFWSLLGPFGS